MKLGTEVGLGPVHIVLDGNPAPLPKRAQPQFSARVCYGQTAAWIEMTLGTELDLGPDDILLREDQLPPKLGAQQPPLFGPSIVAKGWKDQDATW